MNKDIEQLSYQVVGAAIEVHKALGPGLLERIYQECLAYELKLSGHKVDLETQLPVRYKKIEFNSAYRLDLLVNEVLVIEVKAIEKVLPLHKAQLLSYLKLSELKLGLLINFNVPQLKYGIKRIINDL